MDRSGGRGTGEMRPVTITRRYLKHAHGSCLFELGDTKVLCAAMFSDTIAGWRRGSGLGWVTAEYSLLPASTHTRTRREVSAGSPSGRTHEIQRLIGRSLRSVVDMGGMGGEFTLNIDCDVIQADGGTRTAAITGAYVALVDACRWLAKQGLTKKDPIHGQVAAVSVGICGERPVLDLDYSEDSAAETDLNVVMNDGGAFIELQGTAEGHAFRRDELNEMLDLAERGVRELMRLQLEALHG